MKHHHLQNTIIVAAAVGFEGCRRTLSKLHAPDPTQRITSWVMGDDRPIPQYLCWCKRNKLQREESAGNRSDNITNTN